MGYGKVENPTCNICQTGQDGTKVTIDCLPIHKLQWLNSAGTWWNGVPPPVSGVPSPKITVPPRKVVAIPLSMPFRLDGPHGIFGQLIFGKSLQLLPSKVRFKIVGLRLKCTKFYFGWGSPPDPAGRAYSAPPAG